MGASLIKTVDLEQGMPAAYQALSRLEDELAAARKQHIRLVKLIHGYGSTGAGGEIRLAVQTRLREMSENGQIRGCIFGEDWRQSDEQTWKILGANPALKRDPDLGRRNLGITIVAL